MFTVLIQNSATMESFRAYYPLFRETLASGRIGLCRWHEAGTSLESALPELSGLTEDKEHWCALIVRYEDEEAMAACESEEENPYDFLVNKGKESVVEDSEVPLIRLTHMLGGMPPLEPLFKVTEEKDRFGTVRTSYQPVRDDNRENVYEQLVRKYRFDGKAPDQILMLSVRKKQDRAGRDLRAAWSDRRESKSSEFWKRNHYASGCRFMVCDFETQGEVQKEADDFRFWTTVLLLATNEPDEMMMQAYKLYQVRTVLGKSAMEESFQKAADRLRDVKHAIDRDIRSSLEKEIEQGRPLPGYGLRVPVSFRLPAAEMRGVRTTGFGLASRGENADMEYWDSQVEEIGSGFAKAVRSADRTLDQTADRMRDSLVFAEEDVEPLDRYQEEDLERETRELYERVVRIQAGLPTEHAAADSAIAETDRTVRRKLVERVKRPAALYAYALGAACLAGFSIPFIRGSSLLFAPESLAVCLLVPGIAAFAALISQRAALLRYVGKHNRYMEDAYRQLVDNAGNYTDYMSAIASHARGISYLNLSRRIVHRKSEGQTQLFLHRDAIDKLLGRMRKWSRAFYLDTDYDSPRPDVSVEFDVAEKPGESRLYSLESEKEGTVELNRSGMYLRSPFDFAKRIEITREELYDEGNNG